MNHSIATSLLIHPFLFSATETRYRGTKDPIERSHYQIIWLLATGRPTEEVAAVTGYSRNWIYELVWGYNQLGPNSLGDARRQNFGGEPLLSDVQQAQLWQGLQGPAPDGGLWNGRFRCGKDIANYSVERCGLLEVGSIYEE